jgi:hypothetical protein
MNKDDIVTRDKLLDSIFSIVFFIVVFFYGLPYLFPKFQPYEYLSLLWESKSEKLRKKCNVSKDDDWKGFILVRRESPFSNYIQNLKVPKLVYMKVDNGFSPSVLTLQFQNQNEFNIKAIAIGFNPKNEKCILDTSHYEVIMSCEDEKGVSRGSYGTLICQDEAKHFANKPYCLVGFMPYYSVISILDKPPKTFSMVLNEIGLCEK